MRPRVLFNVIVGAAAVLAIALVAGPKLDLGGGDDEGSDEAPGTASTTRPMREAPPRTATKPARGAQRPAVPSNPDDVKGSQEISLHRPANLRRALRVLERERRRAEGVFDGLRVAPGRIDTTIDTSSRKITLQVRADFRVAFRTSSAFPNTSNPSFRKRGLSATAVDLNLPARMLREIDRTRSGSAARDLDYFLIRRDIIDFEVNYGAYLRSGPRPRIFLLEGDKPMRAIG